MSYTGSAKRLWRPVRRQADTVGKVVIGLIMSGLILVAWSAITVWYLFAVWLIFPYRMIRRSQRRNRRDNLAFQEALEEIRNAKTPATR